MVMSHFLVMALNKSWKFIYDIFTSKTLHRFIRQGFLDLRFVVADILPSLWLFISISEFYCIDHNKRIYCDTNFSHIVQPYTLKYCNVCVESMPKDFTKIWILQGHYLSNYDQKSWTFVITYNSLLIYFSFHFTPNESSHRCTQVKQDSSWFFFMIFCRQNLEQMICVCLCLETEMLTYRDPLTSVNKADVFVVIPC